LSKGATLDAVDGDVESFAAADGPALAFEADALSHLRTRFALPRSMRGAGLG